MDTIRKNHSSSHDCFRELTEVWLAGAKLTEDAAREAMTDALQSVRVVRAISGIKYCYALVSKLVTLIIMFVHY